MTSADVPALVLYETSDLNLAAMLMERGLDMQSSADGPNGLVIFQFVDRDRALTLEHEYRYENPKVTLRYFMANLNHLRDLLRLHRGAATLPAVR